MLLHLKYSGEKVNFPQYCKDKQCGVHFFSPQEYSGVGKNSGDYVHINMHKYGHDACANTLDVDMNANACAHACVNAHTRLHICVHVHMHV